MPSLLSSEAHKPPDSPTTPQPADSCSDYDISLSELSSGESYSDWAMDNTPDDDVCSGSAKSDIVRTISIDASRTIQSVKEGLIAQKVIDLINASLMNEGLQLEALGLVPECNLSVMKENTSETKTRALNMYTEELDALKTKVAAVPDNLTYGHLAAILQTIISQYEETDGEIPLEFFSLQSQPVPISWDAVRDVSKPGSFIDATIIDWILCMTPEQDASTDFLASDNLLYADTLRNASSVTSNADSLESTRVRLGSLLREGPKQKYKSSLALKIGSNRLIFPWNPTGLHFVLVLATSTSKDSRAIVVFDTFSNGARRHDATWNQTDILHTFLELVGLYHPPFQGQWPSGVIYGETVQQKDHDCGILTAWAARRLLTGQEIPKIQKTRKFALHLRELYVTEIRCAMDDSEPGAWGAKPLKHYEDSCSEKAASLEKLEQATELSTDSEPPRSLKKPRRTDRTGVYSGQSGRGDGDSKLPRSRKGLPRGANRRTSGEGWLDPQDEEIQNAAAKQSSRNIILAILQASPDGGMDPGPLQDAFKKRAEAVFSKRSSLGVNVHQPGFHKHLLQDGQSNIISVASGASRLFKNPKQNHIIPETAAALFSHDNHVADNSDDIDVSYDLVLTLYRQSAQRSSDTVLKDQVQDAMSKLDSLYSLWNLIFNRNTPHERLDDLSELPHNSSECTRPRWMPFLLGIRSSNQTLFTGTKETRSEEEKIEQAIRKLQSAKRCTLNVLLLFVGVDTLTTDNDTWKGLTRRFQDVDFSITSACPSQMSQWYPSVFTLRYGLAWAHFRVTELRNAFRSSRKASLETTLFREPKLYRWIHWMETLFAKKQIQQRGSRSHQFAELQNRLTVHRKLVLQDIESLALPRKICEECRRSKVSTWCRSQLRPDAVRCSRCVEQPSSSTLSRYSGPSSSPAPEPNKADGLRGSEQSGSRQPAFIQCSVPACMSMASPDLHYGYALCHTHVDLNLVQKCTNCNQTKLMTEQHLRLCYEDTGKCADCTQMCSIQRCERPASTIIQGSPICDWHKTNWGWCPECKKDKYSARWITGLCDWCYKYIKAVAKRRNHSFASSNTQNEQSREEAQKDTNAARTNARDLIDKNQGTVPTASDSASEESVTERSSSDYERPPSRTICSVKACREPATTTVKSTPICSRHRSRFRHCQSCGKHKYDNRWHLNKQVCKTCYDLGRQKMALKSTVKKPIIIAEDSDQDADPGEDTKKKRKQHVKQELATGTNMTGIVFESVKSLRRPNSIQKGDSTRETKSIHGLKSVKEAKSIQHADSEEEDELYGKAGTSEHHALELSSDVDQKAGLTSLFPLELSSDAEPPSKRRRS